MKVRMSVQQKNPDKFIARIIEKYHFESSHMDMLTQIYYSILECATPHAIYRINQWVTGDMLIDSNQAAVAAITLGEEVDELQEAYTASGKLLEAYMVDCIADEMLLYLYGEFNKIYERFHRRYVYRYVFVGDSIPLSDMRDILIKIGGKDLDTMDINANEFGVLTPSKSVVFYALISDNPSNRCGGICESCNNPECDYKAGSEKVKNKITLNYGYQRILGGSH